VGALRHGPIAYLRSAVQLRRGLLDIPPPPPPTPSLTRGRGGGGGRKARGVGACLSVDNSPQSSMFSFFRPSVPTPDSPYLLLRHRMAEVEERIRRLEMERAERETELMDLRTRYAATIKRVEVRLARADKVAKLPTNDLDVHPDSPLAWKERLRR